MITSSPERIKEYSEKGFWENKSLHGLLDILALEKADFLAVADQPDRENWASSQNLRISFSELDNAATNFACQLLDNGVEVDDIVVVQLPNIVELVVCYFAVSKSGDPPRFYRLVGRSKDIINRGGMKICPAEIDVLLEGLPNVIEAALCSYPDERLGEI